MALIVGVGCIVILMLTGVTIALWRKVWAVERTHSYREKLRLEHETRDNPIFDSLYVLAQSVTSNQVRVAEAGIRMAILLDHFELTCEQKHLFSPIVEIYNRTRHIPTHDRLNRLDKIERRQYEKELKKIESELTEGLKKSAYYITDPSLREKQTLH